MGLTIHYSLRSHHSSPAELKSTVRQMRQLALDLPFEEVGEIVSATGKQCNFEARRAELQNSGDAKKESLFWLLVQARDSMQCPWNKHYSKGVLPTHLCAFTALPGPGSEPANLGLALFPAQVAWEYDPEDDLRFHSPPKCGGWPSFDLSKWQRHLQKLGRKPWESTTAFREMRQVPTKLTEGSWSSFCKTQNASNPACGGIPNFLRCHISVITLLERIAKLPGMKVRINDEGRYGPANYSTDYEEKYKAGLKPTYPRHKGKYNPRALAEEVGEWNNMMAGFVGALSDALASSKVPLQAPIKEFPNFEQLEFRGRQTCYLEPFLQAMKTLAVPTPTA